MTRTELAPADQNPLLADWTGPFGLPPLPAIAAGAFPPGLRRRAGRAPRRDRRDRRQCRQPPSFDNTIEALESSGRDARACRQCLFRAGRRRHRRRHRGGRARHVAAARPPQQRALSQPRALCPHRRPLRAAATRSGSTPSRRACSTATTPASCGPAARSTSRRRTAWPRSTSGWRASAPSSGRTCWPTRNPTRCCWRRAISPACPTSRAPRRARRRRSAAHPGKYAITLARSSVRALPAILGAPRPAREGIPGLDQARRERRRDRQPRAHRRDARSARRTGEAARLCKLSPTTGWTTRWPRPRHAARELLDEVWGRARAKAAAERDALAEDDRARRAAISRLQPWDWRYYAEKLRKARYDLDEAEIKPYFQLDQMVAAAFDTAHRLFGLSFTPVDVPLYHPDARAFEVKDASGAPCRPVHRRLFRARLQALRRLDDLAARPGEACRRGPADHPQRLQFRQAGGGRAALLSFDDARTLFHEFGHALHGLLSNVTYPLLAGTSVPSDFVELPSQLYEHWLECRRSCRNTRAMPRPASRCRRRCSTACSPRAPSTRASPRWNTPPARWSISICMRCRMPRSST